MSEINPEKTASELGFDPDVLDNIEKVIFRLRYLYDTYGYEKYRMSKFEEYDLYVRNKDYLVSDSVITFTDTTGKLKALKPDVTLSIIKNTKDLPDRRQKLFYNENVYRVSKSTESFKEILQTGLECLGNIDASCIGEVLLLAAKSLELISSDYVIETASLDILTVFLNKITTDPVIQKDILKCVNEKNVHSLMRIAEDNKLDKSAAEDLASLIRLYGPAETVLPKLKDLCSTKDCERALKEMEQSLEIAADSGAKEKILVDFSVVSDLKYYNGMIFKGFIKGIPDSVLKGGQYDNLMKRMGKTSKAIGFAVYLDLLDGIVL